MSLSVVTITFNDSRGLKKTLKTMPTKYVEWIVVDGSTDPDQIRKNRELVGKLNCRLIQEPDSGRFNAMNKGLKMASRNIICFMNSGDSFAKSTVPKSIVESYNKHRWRWAVGQTICVDIDDKFQWKWIMPKHNSLKLKLSIRAYSHQATVYETKELLKIGGFYEGSIYSDWAASLVLSKLSKPHIESDVWCHFLKGGISSLQTIDFWNKECVRLREVNRIQILGNGVIDKAAQSMAAWLLKLDRGGNLLLRPDLR